MADIHSTRLETEQQPINQIVFLRESMEPVPHLRADSMQHRRDDYEKEYIDFIDLAAHELDAPLRKLSILVERLTSKFETVSQDKDVQSNIERIDHCIRDMRSAIDELSVLGRVAAADNSQYESCNIEKIVKDVLQSLTISVDSKKAKVTVDQLPVVKGNAVQLTRLFKCLLENSIKFTRDHIVPEIHIRSSLLGSDEKSQYHLDQLKQYYKIEFVDNGIGFKNENAEKIFRPFVRLNGKSKFSGSGIGLAICRKVAENHRGLIYAESRENEGSTFTILLPETH